jgi:hypothetical protein
MVTNNKLTTATARGARPALGIVLGVAALVVSSFTSASAQYVPWIYGADGAYHFGGYYGPDSRWVTPGPNYSRAARSNADYARYASSRHCLKASVCLSARAIARSKAHRRRPEAMEAFRETLPRWTSARSSHQAQW